MAIPSDYELRFEPCPKRVRVEVEGVCIAESSRAIVLHETRLPAAYYIPPGDVRMDLLEKTAHRTHCPFKGDASYWSLKLAERAIENIAWAYEEPFPDAEPIRGLLSFYRGKVSALYEGEEKIPFVAAPGTGALANPLAHWLLKEAWKATTMPDLAEQFFAFLRGAGWPLARSTVIVPTLHPQVFATVLVWRADTPGVRVVYEPHDILTQPRFADSPFAPIIRGAPGVRRRLEDPGEKLDFPIVRELRAEGATDYVAMPFRFSDGQVNVMSMTSFTPGGFSAAQLGQLFEVMPMLGRALEVHALRRVATALLETYLGRHTGERVLDGQVKLGDGEHIHAVIWFCDLRDSTSISERMEREAYLAHLNRFLYCMAGAVLDSGGEVLRYIGDAALAIFPIAGGAREACERAVAAAKLAGERIRAVNAQNPGAPPLRYGIGLHLGTVTYGNIGIPQRLEFTVIGPAANEAARVESMTKDLGRAVLASGAFAAAYGGALVSLGRHRLKGVKEEHELFTLPDA
jgi:class 3 adenylate cyclase/uncharacterized protein (DUF427 family)